MDTEIQKIEEKPAAPQMRCPRRAESPRPEFPEGGDRWREDDTCSYCGSLNPDTLMKRSEAGTVSLGPTDKSYKVYVKNLGGEMFKQSFRDCPPGSACTGPNDCTHWTSRPRNETKFYFQHLSIDQRKKFVELYNEKSIIIDEPGYFYVLPFFAVPEEVK